MEEAKTTKKVGTVVNCKYLNVREKAFKDAKVVTILDAGTEVTILSEGPFLKVVVDDKELGFCMKEYIKIKG